MEIENILSEIIMTPFRDTQYFKEEIPKTQIYLHHTAGSANPNAVFSGWGFNTERIATAFVIGGKQNKQNGYKDGAILQGFSSKHWAYHLGLKKETFAVFKIPYQSLDKISIGIEICNWGWVTKTDKGWETYVGTLVDESEIIEYEIPFKGRHHYHRYTEAQIESTRKLLIFLGNKYGIDLKYNEDIWGITAGALSGLSGIFTHNSVRSDKCDVHPCPNLIAMLKSL